jgi:transposase, IS5 family
MQPRPDVGRNGLRSDVVTSRVHPATTRLASTTQRAMRLILKGPRAARNEATVDRCPGCLRRRGASSKALVIRLARSFSPLSTLVNRELACGIDLVLELVGRDRDPIDRKPVEFGYKAQVVDNVDGVILDHSVEIGNPADAPQLAPAITRITERMGRAPTAVTADRGYGYATVEADLHDLGVRTVAIPRARRPPPPGASSSTEKPSAPRSNGAPDAKVESTTSNAATAGTGPN